MTDTATIDETREPIQTTIARLSYMVNGQIGRSWNTGRSFVLHTKGDEFTAIQDAVAALQAQRAEIARLNEECQCSMREIAAGRERAEAAEAKLAEVTRERDEALDDAKFAERIAAKREIDANARAEAAEAEIASLTAERDEAAEKEREACAKVADTSAQDALGKANDWFNHGDQGSAIIYNAQAEAAGAIAAAIRARIEEATDAR